jgi:transposase
MNIPNPELPIKEAEPALNSKKDYLDALFYVLRTGCSWRNLPHDFPKWQSVYMDCTQNLVQPQIGDLTPTP